MISAVKITACPGMNRVCSAGVVRLLQESWEWSGRALADCHGPSASDFVEEGSIDGDILDCPGNAA
jgi:hypothetical protein